MAMKKDKNKDRRSRSQKAGDQPQQNSPRESNIRNEESRTSVGGSLTSGEKKPISHKTGDATNFGDRSYRED
jgi:hypothetical protein